MYNVETEVISLWNRHLRCRNCTSIKHHLALLFISTEVEGKEWFVWCSCDIYIWAGELVTFLKVCDSGERKKKKKKKITPDELKGSQRMCPGKKCLGITLSLQFCNPSCSYDYPYGVLTSGGTAVKLGDLTVQLLTAGWYSVVCNPWPRAKRWDCLDHVLWKNL